MKKPNIAADLLEEIDNKVLMSQGRLAIYACVLIHTY